jgi:predicted ArsR family transcriptional regulator
MTQTSLQIIKSLATWFTLAQFADRAGCNRQKARHTLAKLYKDGLVEYRTICPECPPNEQRREWIITAKGRERNR